MSTEILINQLFAGRYLEEGENIGHEVINLFKDDNGNNNIFVTHSGQVKNHNLEYILFVRNVAARKTVEVVGLAKGLHSISEEDVKRIRYANISLDQIFEKNTYREKKESFDNHVTFRADYFLLPSCRVFITIDEKFNIEEYTLKLCTNRQVIIPQGMREYYSKDNDEKAYKQLKKFINDSKIWKEDNTIGKLNPDGAVQNQSPSFLEVIRKEDDEAVFSNLLGYFFEYSHLAFQRFATDSNLLNIKDMSASFVIHRETVNRIDLWIESERDIIVIENKIKSGINGITGKDYSQLNKYYETAEEKARKHNKRTHYYIFAPDYARFDISKYGLKNTYIIIYYSKIRDFFIREADVYIADRSFPDFVRGLKRHTLSFAELQFDTMRTRLLRKINDLQ